MTRYVLALDQGTTSSRAIVFDRAGAIVAHGAARVPADLSAARLGRARRRGDLGDAARDVAARRWRRPGAPRRDVAAIGITNQRETTVVWDRATGRPVAPRHRLAGPAHGRRSASSCRPTATSRLIRERTGLRARPLLLRHQARLDARPRARRARRAPSAANSPSARSTAGSSGKLTGGARARHRRDQRIAHAAARHPRRGDWDDELLDAARRAARGAARGRAVAAASSADRCRRCSAAVDPDRRHRGRPAGGAVRSGAASTPGMAKNTYGTGCFMLMQHGRRAVAVAAQAC